MQAYWRSKARQALMYLTLTIVVAILTVALRLGGCARQDEPGDAQAPNPEPVSCGELQVGDEKTEPCGNGDEGTRVFVCLPGGLREVENHCQATPPPPPTCQGRVRFSAVHSILERECSSCHPSFTRYEVAKDKINDFLTRVNRTDALRMPQKNPANLKGELSQADKDTLSKWQQDGLQDDECDETPPPPPAKFVSFYEVERIADDHVNGLKKADQANAVYFSAVDRLDAGEDVEQWRQGLAKALNMVSTKSVLYKPEKIGDGLWYVDLDKVGVDAVAWKRIEDAAVFQLQSRTQRGKELQRLTGKRIPIMLVADFVDTVMRNSGVYYDTLKLAPKAADFLAQQGVDFNGDLQDLAATFGAFNGSPLSLQANRLVVRLEGGNFGSSFYFTGDTGAIKNDQQSAFKNPCVFPSGCNANLRMAAGEFFGVLPNGMLVSYLSDTKQFVVNVNGKPVEITKFNNRLDQADPAIVHDFRSGAPTAPFIINPLSCGACHNAGMIHYVDQVGPKLKDSGLQAADKNIATALFKGQERIDAELKEFNDAYCAALQRIDIDCNKADPVNAVSDFNLGRQNLREVAARFNRTPEELTECIGTSNEVRAQLGQLTSGGDATHDQVAQVQRQIIDECLFLDDPL